MALQINRKFFRMRHDHVDKSPHQILIPPPGHPQLLVVERVGPALELGREEVVARLALHLVSGETGVHPGRMDGRSHCRERQQLLEKELPALDRGITVSRSAVLTQ